MEVMILMITEAMPSPRRGYGMGVCSASSVAVTHCMMELNWDSPWYAIDVVRDLI